MSFSSPSIHDMLKHNHTPAGLFFYDVFWVFFTPVMVSVAKNFEAPIKLLFPRYLVDGVELGTVGLQMNAPMLDVRL